VTCYLNGEFLPLEEARIPVLDRGFIFGDGVYEVVPVYGRRPYRIASHLARLGRSLAAVRIANLYTPERWEALITELVARQPHDDQSVYLQVTRGVARRDHAFPAQATPTVFAMASELVPVPAAQREGGIAAITLPDERWLHCDIKSVSLLGNVLARQAAVDAGAAECLMFRDGFLTEGSSSNVWVVRQGTVFGPPRDHRILEGIRVGLLDELCARSGIPMQTRPVLREEVLAADELMVSSATKEVVAVTRLDGRPVGSGRPGPVYQALYQAYQAAKQAEG
jgi:D-alanine transaminase